MDLHELVDMVKHCMYVRSNVAAMIKIDKVCVVLVVSHQISCSNPTESHMYFSVYKTSSEIMPA